MNIIDQGMGHSQSTHKLHMAALFKRKRDPTRNESTSKAIFTLVNNQSQSVLVQQNNTANYLTSPVLGGSLRYELSKTQASQMSPDSKQSPFNQSTVQYLAKHSTMLQQTMKAANAS